MRFVVSLCLFLACGLPAFAATLTANSVAKADVQAKVDLASDGDTIMVPAGSANYGGANIVISKQLTIIGSGTNSCIITNSAKGYNFLITVDHVRISGFQFGKAFNGGVGADDQAIVLQGKNCGGTGNELHSVRVDNCLFVGGRRQVSWTGYAYGVVDHSGFRGGDIGVSIEGDNKTGWARPYQIGSSNAVYMEDCYFTQTDDQLNEQVYTNPGGGRWVLRSCTLATTPNVTFPNLIDVHGNGNLTDTCSGQRGNVSTEMYNNNLVFGGNGGRCPYLRGGANLVISNAYFSVNGASIMLAEEETWTNLSNFGGARTNWPFQDQITNNVIAGNTLNGQPFANVVLNKDTDKYAIQLHRDYNTELPAGGFIPFPYPHPLTLSPTSAGSVSFSATGYTVSESGGTVTVTAQRKGSTAGAIGVAYSTSDGTALAGQNYSAKTGSLGWSDGDGADKTFTVTILDDTTCGNPTFSVSLGSPTGGAALGTPSSATVTITGDGSSTPPLLTGLGPWTPAQMAICAPYGIAGGLVSQDVTTTDPTMGGRMAVSFTAPATANYTILADVNSPADDSNSCFIDVDASPTTACIWDTALGSGKQYAAWTRGANPGSPHVWALSAGQHTITVCGREPGMQIASLQVFAVSQGGIVTRVATTAAGGYYGIGASIPISVQFSTNVTVTGTPILRMNNGLTLNYSSGTGTTNLVFGNTVAAGNDTQALDVLGIDALSGTIKDANGVDMVLTLPAPGGPGSVSGSKAVIIDTAPPTVSIGEPPTRVTSTADVPFVVTFSDANLSAAPVLTTNTIVINKTGTADCTATVSGPTFAPTVTLTGISGTGTLSFSLLSGALTDLAGLTTPAAGPSAVVSVETYKVLVLKTLTATNVVVQQP